MTHLIYYKFHKIYEKYENIFIISLLLLFCLLGIFLRFIYIHHSLWIDELTTAWVIEGNYKDILTRCWINNLSPLYYSILYLSKLLFGYSELGLRMPGLIFGVITIPLFYVFTYKLTSSKKLSLFVSFFSSIEPSLIYNSLEIRPYIFVIFFTLLHFYIFLFFLQQKRKILYGAILGVLTAIIILFHYTAALFFIVEVVIAIYYYTNKQSLVKQDIYGMLLIIFIPFILILPIIPHLLYLFENNHVLGSFIEKRSFLYIFRISPQFLQYIFVPLLVGLFLNIFISKNKKRHSSPNKFAMIYLLSWFFIPILLSWVLTKFNIANIFYGRYLAWTIPAAILGLAIVIDYFYLKRIILIVALCMLVMINARFLSNFGKEKNIKKNIYLSITHSPYDIFGWKDAVNMINNFQLELSKIYVYRPLIESNMLGKQIHDEELLNDYLLSGVNSLYKLNSKYLEITQPINSIEEIPNTISNYIVICRSYPSDFDDGVSLTPANKSGLFVYYFN